MVPNKKIVYIFLLLWMVVILAFSSEPAARSRAKSRFVVEKVEPIIQKAANLINIKLPKNMRFHFWVRKYAHLLNYFVLAILSYSLFRKAVGCSLGKTLILSMILVISFACIDEAYQTFVPGRGGQVKDVWIDTAGGAAGLGAALIAERLEKCLRKAKKVKTVHNKL